MKNCKGKKHKKKKKLRDYLAEVNEMKLVAEAAYMDGFKHGVKLGIAKRLLKEEVDIEIIARATFLTLAEIEELKNEEN